MGSLFMTNHMKYNFGYMFCYEMSKPTAPITIQSEPSRSALAGWAGHKTNDPLKLSMIQSANINVSLVRYLIEADLHLEYSFTYS